MNRVDPTGMDWYEAEDGSVMWRKMQDGKYTDDTGNVWWNIGQEYLFGTGENATLFKQNKNENGELFLYSTKDSKDILSYYGRKFREEHPVYDPPLQNVYPEFDVLMLGKFVFTALSKALVTNAAKTGTNVINNTAKQAQSWLGKDYKVITNKAGDNIFMSKDGLRKIRFDINNPHGYPPHIQLEKFVNGKWQDAIPGVHHIYPKP